MNLLNAGGTTHGTLTTLKYFSISCISDLGISTRPGLQIPSTVDNVLHGFVSALSSGASSAGSSNTKSAFDKSAPSFMCSYQLELNSQAEYWSKVTVIAAFFDAPGMHTR